MIAYYAHQHGFGHSNSAQEFCKLYNKKALVITSSSFIFDESTEVIEICNEDSNNVEYQKTTGNLPGYAHYLPKSENKILYRNYQILETCLSDDIKFALIDVSVETAIQFRIAGIPYAYHKMLGNREDLPHQLAFEASEFLFAYYPKEIESATKTHFVDKTYYLGFISRFRFRYARNLRDTDKGSNLKILILTGNGGTKLTSPILKAICQQIYRFKYTLIGGDNTIKLANVKHMEFTNDLESLISNHDIVISSCGINLTAEILSIKNKFIAVQEDRPYNEQQYMLSGLLRHNLAVELDTNDIESSINKLIALPVNQNLKSFFGKMEMFNTIKELKYYL